MTFHFGWNTVEKQFIREKKRIKFGYTKDTRLIEKSITPNKYDKMGVEPAKHVFESKCINEHIINISKRLGYYNTMIILYPDNENFHNNNKYKVTERKLNFYISRLDFLCSMALNARRLISLRLMPSKSVSKEDKDINQVKIFWLMMIHQRSSAICLLWNI